jgi:LruC domain-containing protein
MKIRTILLTNILLLFSASINAQYSNNAVSTNLILDAESGNIGVDIGNCWRFTEVSYTSLAENIITGSFSLRSGQINSHSLTNTFLKTPWMKVGAGNITFKIKLSSGTAPQTRGVRVSYIPYNPSSPATGFEGAGVLFYSYEYENVNDLTIKNIVVPIPSAIENSTGVYKIMVSFVGQTGSGRIISDDYVFPGTYWSNPTNSCNPLPLVAPPGDADGDGVPDVDDEFPNDPYRSHTSYYPSMSQYGTLAFEDNWPRKGDYDFNDLVVDYKMTTVTNANGHVVEVIGSFILRASGASFNNGFGIQFDGIAPNKISKVTGNNPGSYARALNGTEPGQTFASLIIFDNFFSLMSRPPVGIGVNTDKKAPYVTPVSQQVIVTFIDNGVAPSGGVVTPAQLTSSSFNFFMFINRDRGREVHLPDRLPTSLATTGLFGTNDDNSNPATGRYYRTSNNLPWAINILDGFEYTTEKVSIDQGHLHFVDWAVSAGVSFPDWYMNKPGYRNPEKIY